MGQHPSAPVHINTHASARTHSIILSPSLVLYTPLLAAGDTACKKTEARKFPALILLTFSVTRHFSARRRSTHSVRDAASAERRLRLCGSPRPPQCQRTSELWAALGGYYRLLNQPFRSVIIETQKAAFRVRFSRISSPVLLSIILKEGRFSITPYAITFTAPLLTTSRAFKTRWRSTPKGLHFTTLYTRLIIKLASHSSLFFISAVVIRLRANAGEIHTSLCMFTCTVSRGHLGGNLFGVELIGALPGVICCLCVENSVVRKV